MTSLDGRIGTQRLEAHSPDEALHCVFDRDTAWPTGSVEVTIRPVKGPHAISSADIVALRGNTGPFLSDLSIRFDQRESMTVVGCDPWGRDPPQDRQRVKDMGGLYVIGTNRHESRRIDDQLRGRAGRQGDPGESRFFISLEDDLDERIVETFCSAEITETGIDLAKEGLAGPSATWTYLISDNPFGDALQRLLRGLKRCLAAESDDDDD